ncbi:SSI family serine proteinase inhibitor [Streptomyces sp. CNQ085]|uniref:SSI family serine proteinase inhibitor n=1 Tax=Streptomyces sp. CNQ085 TaxID=2886944 RepID=UPI001F5058D7|nr:SSI family serine proteinase inhibitor [Streptomyces sp. CNQ085]MCI0386948.1 protease inhibitor [Streptomyces sp. CNQ085]
MFPRPRTAAAAALAAVAAFIVPASAALAKAPASEPAHGEVFLTVSDAEDTWTRGVMLVCPDDGSGPHPRAAEACEAIDQSGGELRQLSGRQRDCTNEYRPVVADITGTWRGSRIHWRSEFPNACALLRQTGAVFDF